MSSANETVAASYTNIELGVPTATPIVKKAVEVPEEENVIMLSDLPAEIAAALSPLDLDGDGTISVSEILALRRQEQDEVKSKETFQKMLFGFIFVWFIQIVAVFGVSIWGAQLATPYSLGSSAQMTSKSTGETVQVANSDFCISNGITVLRDVDGYCPTGTEAESMATVSAEFANDLTSDLSDDFFASLMFVELPSPSGNFLKVDVNGFMRDYSDDSVRLLTTAGVMHLKNESFACTDASTADYKIFENSGYAQGSYYHLDAASNVVADSTPVRATRSLQGGQPPRPPPTDDASAPTDDRAGPPPPPGNGGGRRPPANDDETTPPQRPLRGGRPGRGGNSGRRSGGQGRP